MIGHERGRLYTISTLEICIIKRASSLFHSSLYLSSVLFYISLDIPINMHSSAISLYLFGTTKNVVPSCRMENNHAIPEVILERSQTQLLLVHTSTPEAVHRVDQAEQVHTDEKDGGLLKTQRAAQNPEHPVELEEPSIDKVNVGLHATDALL